MRKRGGLYIILSVILGAIMLAAPVAAQLSGDRGSGTPAIRAADISRHIRYLASEELEGRFTGSPGARKAADYIAAEFRRDGLKPVGDEGSYFQHFPFIAGVSLGEENRLETTIDGRTHRWRLKEDFAPMTFSTQEPVDAHVAFVGYGISAPDVGYDDYASLDVEGRLVLVLRFTPEGESPHSKFWRYAGFRTKALTARQHGAKAIAFIADSQDFKSNTLSHPEFDYSFADSGIVALGMSRRVANELVATTGTSLEAVEKKISDSHRPDSHLLPGVTAGVRVDLLRDTKQAANVVSFLPGTDPRLKDEVIIIGAHYDHLGLGGHNSLAPNQVGQVHNGADDNASGVAGVLELAQAFAARRSDLKRGLLFIAFCGEEEGLLGSNYYVKHPLFPLARTAAMINMDMIGRLRHRRLIVQGIGTSPQWTPLIEELNRTDAFDVRTTADGAGPSDHASFYLKKVPVLFFFTGVHGDYHRPSDDYEKINAEGEARVVRFVYQAVSRLQAWRTRPAFSKTKSSQRRSRGFRVSLGTIPDYAEAVDGLKLSGIREGSPAAKAGLQAGDIIIRLGRIQVKNIYDYSFALGELKAGEQVEIEILRGGRRLVLAIVPEKRS